MDYDDILSDIFAEPEKNVQQVNEPVNGSPVPEIVEQALCECGDPESAHPDGGACSILECGCDGFIPMEGIPDLTGTISVEFTNVTYAEANEEQANARLQRVEPSTEALPEGYCAHICDNPDCMKWWTHGPKGSCKYPDLLKQGLCQHCSGNGETFQIDFESDFKDGKLSPAAQIKTRNDEAFICKDMDIRQLSNHIEYLHRRVEEIRTRELHTRKMRADLEEEQLANIPEHEREKFIQELRQGEKKPRKSSKPKTAKSPALMSTKSKEAALITQLRNQGKSNEEAKVIASTMVKTGKTQEQVEKWLYE